MEATWQPASSGADCKVVFLRHYRCSRTHERLGAHCDQRRGLRPLLPRHSNSAEESVMITLHLFLSHSWQYGHRGQSW